MEIRIESISRIILEIEKLGFKVEPLDENIYISKSSQTAVNFKISGDNHYFVSFKISRELLHSQNVEILVNNMSNILSNIKVEYDAWDKRKNLKEDIPTLTADNLNAFIQNPRVS